MFLFWEGQVAVASLFVFIVKGVMKMNTKQFDTLPDDWYQDGADFFTQDGLCHRHAPMIVTDHDIDAARVARIWFLTTLEDWKNWKDMS